MFGAWEHEERELCSSTRSMLNLQALTQNTSIGLVIITGNMKHFSICSETGVRTMLALSQSRRLRRVTSRRQRLRPQLAYLNRFAPLSEAPAEEPVKGTRVIGDAVVQHVILAIPLGAPEETVTFLPGARAPDISCNLRLLGNRRYLRVVIYIRANDIRLRQSEITKANIKEVIKQAQTLSEEVICSGPIPIQRRGNEVSSRLSSLNRWMSKWCAKNHVGFIYNWLKFKGKPGLLGRDGVHPTWEGHIIYCTIIGACNYCAL
uniref:SGNH hydrolase-type esterase domain-containing protein n=1 Tax=Astyanax mexicanus TaxID=7994 RepID=A0A8B9H6Y7_ASTMX